MLTASEPLLMPRFWMMMFSALRARGSGVFAEPAGAAAYAGLVKAVDNGLVSVDDRVVVVNTGNGLKDVQSAMKAVEISGNRPRRVGADFEQFKDIWRGND
jgi:threonine synthase